MCIQLSGQQEKHKRSQQRVRFFPADIHSWTQVKFLANRFSEPKKVKKYEPHVLYTYID